MNRTASPARRALALALIVQAFLALSVPSCGNDSDTPVSEVRTLRILAVRADTPYAAPGGEVTFQMTYADALGDPGDPPRPVQVTWLGGCLNPPGDGDEYLGCFAQFQDIFKGLGSGTGNAADRFHQEIAPPELSGVPDALSFKMSLPPANEVFKGADPTETGSVYSTAYVFFAVCAGTVRIASDPVATGFPLECVDGEGTVLGPGSFVAGYTQVYVFGDNRPNSNPPIDGVTLDGQEIDEAASVERCVLPETTDTEAQGCNQSDEDECATYKIEALVKDVAELDEESEPIDGPTAREAIWVDYYADGGSFEGYKKLVNDPATGYRKDHATKWTPPSEAGTVSLWAVVHDARGGASVVRRMITVK